MHTATDTLYGGYARYDYARIALYFIYLLRGVRALNRAPRSNASVHLAK